MKNIKKEYVAFISNMSFKRLSSDNVEDAMREAGALFCEDFAYIKLLESDGVVTVEHDEIMKRSKVVRTFYQEILSTRDGQEWHTHEKCGVFTEVEAFGKKHVLFDPYQETVEVKAVRADHYNHFGAYCGSYFFVHNDCHFYGR